MFDRTPKPLEYPAEPIWEVGFNAVNIQFQYVDKLVLRNVIEIFPEVTKNDPELKELGFKSVYKYRLYEHIFRQRIGDNAQETLAILAINSIWEVVGYYEVAKTTVDTVHVSVQDIMKCCLLSNASILIMAHNHPTDYEKPSPDDDALTEQVGKACDIMGIRFLDHVIIGQRNKSYSYKKNKRLKKYFYDPKL